MTLIYTATTTGDLIHQNIHQLVTAFDAHDAGLEYPTPMGHFNGETPTYVCPCGFRGPEQEWEQHLASVLSDIVEVTRV